MDSRPYYIGKDGIIIEYEDISSHIIQDLNKNLREVDLIYLQIF